MSSQTEKSTVFFITRLVAGVIFVKHGIAKLGSGYQSWIDFMNTKNISKIFAISAIIAEICIGFLLILGIFTRLSALLGLIFMLVAIYIAHDKDPLLGDKGISNQVLLCLLLLGICITGSGNYAVKKD